MSVRQLQKGVVQIQNAPKYRFPIPEANEQDTDLEMMLAVDNQREMLHSSPAKTLAGIKNDPLSSSALEIAGLGFETPKTVKSKPTIADELPYLGGMEVIEEVFDLLYRLETDRQQTEQALFQQKQKARNLQKKIDELAVRRAKEYPNIVQAEHDSAVEDLNELNWHVTYKIRMEEKLKERVNNANIFHDRVNEDISFVQKHCPLVEEKLGLEQKAVQDINDAQSETDRELDATCDRLHKTKVRNDEAHTKAATERDNIAKDIHEVNQQLQAAIIEHEEAVKDFEKTSQILSETRQQIIDNIEEKKFLIVKCENAKTTEQMKIRRVDELTNKTRVLDTERHKLEDECFNKQQDFDVTKSTLESQYAELKKAVTHEEWSLKAITQANDDLVLEIDNLTRKITKCDTGIVEDEQLIRRMTTQIHNTELMMNQMLDEFVKMQTIHGATKEKLQEERERVSHIEDNLRQTLEGMKKTCKDEIQTRGTLNSRITSDSSELQKSQVEAKQKKEKLSKTVVEIEEQLKVVNSQVDSLKEVYNAKKEILDGLESEITATREEQVKVEESFEQTQLELNPHLNRIKNKYEDLIQDLANMVETAFVCLNQYDALKSVSVDRDENELSFGVKEWSSENSVPKMKAFIEKRIRDESKSIKTKIANLSNQMDLMAKKKEEMDHSSRILDKSVKQNELAVERLKKQLDELTKQLEDQTMLTTGLKTSIDDVLSRTEMRQREHNSMMTERLAIINKHTLTLDAELKENGTLAKHYRTVQGEYTTMKSEYMDMFDERNRLEAGIKDLKQIKGLQSRMHKALETYYKFRGLFNSSELERIEAENRTSSVKVERLQEGYGVTVESVIAFLQSQMKILESRSVVEEYNKTKIEQSLSRVAVND